MNLTLHLTADCNLRCRYCYETHCKNHMTWDTARQAVDLVFSYGTRPTASPCSAASLCWSGVSTRRSAGTPRPRPGGEASASDSR